MAYRAIEVKPLRGSGNNAHIQNSNKSRNFNFCIFFGLHLVFLMYNRGKLKKLNVRRLEMKRYLIVLFISMVMFSAGAFGQTIGWLNNSSGTYDYFDTANWQDGIVSGLFSTNLTSKTTQYVQFGADFDVTGATFNFDHPGEITFYFRGDGAGNRTATLLEDIEISPATTKGNITFGWASEGYGLDFNLGGESRSIITLFRNLYFRNAITNGKLLITGNDVDKSWLRFEGDQASAAGVEVEVDKNTTLYVITSGSGSTLADALTLRSGTLRIAGNSSSDSTNIISGDLTVASHPEGTISTIYMDANSSKNAQLRAQALVRQDGAILAVSDENFGGTPGPNMANIFFDTPPSMIGAGGEPGTTTNSIIPWILGARSISNYDDTLVSYHPDYGLRPLDYDTEMLNYTNVPLGEVTQYNVFVPETNIWDVSQDTTINALVTEGGESTPRVYVTGTGTLHVASGFVLLGYLRWATPTIDCPLDFGTQQGIFMYAAGKGSAISGPISGSGGLVLYQNSTSVAATGIQLTSSCTYTGDTFVHGRAEFKNPEFLPQGERTGDLYVYGNPLIGGGTYYINGLNGSGTLSGVPVNLYVGDNDADGHFMGSYKRSKYTCYLTKIGTGTQIFSGIIDINGGIDIEAGTLVLDGLFTYSETVSGIDIKDGGTLRGAGTIDIPGISTAINVQSGGTLAPGSTNGFGTMSVAEGDVVFEDGALMEVKGDSNGFGAISVAGDVTGDVTVPVTVTGEGSGEWLILEASSIEPDFVSVTSGVELSLREGGTELWLTREPQGSLFIIE